MTRNNLTELVEPNPKIKRIAVLRLREELRQREEELDIQFEQEQQVIMAEQQRTMFDYARPDMSGTESSIVRLAVAAKNFEIKPNIIQMVQQFVQFDGLQDEDSNALS